MPEHVLSAKELKVKREFEKCGLEEISVQSATLGSSDSLFLVNDAVLFKIKNTNSFLLYGSPVNYTNILNQLKETAKDPEKFKEMMKEKLKREGNEENIIDGDAVEDEIDEITKATEKMNIEPSSFNEDDVNLIMSEVKISRAEAIEALSKANNDVIQALVDLNKEK
ncbi:hypothetical protein GINT2_000742 [Glugoides intestinalis]